MRTNARIVQPLPTSVVDRIATDTNPLAYDSTDFQIPCPPMNCPGVNNDKVLVKIQSEGAFPITPVFAKAVDTIGRRIAAEGFFEYPFERAQVFLCAGEPSNLLCLRRPPYPS